MGVKTVISNRLSVIGKVAPEPEPEPEPESEPVPAPEPAPAPEPEPALVIPDVTPAA
jgi:hypothetical protein